MEEVTFCMIKPDATSKGYAGEILSILEKKGFTILKARTMHLTTAFCEGFYQEHRERDFFSDLVQFITSGVVWGLALKRKDACLYLREVMGATNPKEAQPSTLRASFGESIDRNAIHGSDSLVSARRELALFFPEDSF